VWLVGSGTLLRDQFPISQGGTYDFFASAAGTGVKALSQVGTIGR
jgi:ABC-type molybdate transport system substrate-binding protein